MTLWAADSLLQVGGIRAGFEQLRIIIALDQHCVQRSDYVWQTRENVTHVREDSDPVVLVFYHKCGAVDTVMGRWNGFDTHIVEANALASVKVPYIEQLSKPPSALGLGQRRLSHIQGQPELALVDSSLRDVVGMFMGYYYGLNPANIAPECR